MKRLIKAIIFVCIAIVVAIATYRFSLRKAVPDAQPAAQVAAILEQNGCYECHDGASEKPFYASLPVVGSMLNKHIEHGTGFIDLKKADLDNPTEVLLSMIEYTLQHDNMPIMEYKLAHWGTGYNKEEKSVLAQWILNERAARYATGLATAEMANEPVQVLPDAVPTDSAKVALGFKMYNDTRISLDNTIACATCHILAQGGADEADERTSEGINGNHGGVNAPTVYNALFNVDQFWNGRAHTLADQASGPPVNPMEMGAQTWDQIVERLREDKALVAEFTALYPEEGLTQATVTDAIGEFEKTLITPNDKLDQYLKGNNEALTTQELAGYKAFKDNTCATCHVGKTLGGQSFELMGIFEDYFAVRAQERPEIVYNDDDNGLKGFTGNDGDLHKFKVPNLRNLALTAPYYHDGSQNTIEDAVRGMFRYELGKTATDDQVNSISAFLRSLNGENQYLTQE